MAAKAGVQKLPPVVAQSAVGCSKNQTPTLARRTTEEVIAINASLLAEIEMLKLKLEVEKKQQESRKSSLKNESEQRVKTRELEIENLKVELRKRNYRMTTASEEAKGKQREITDLQLYIENLKEDVQSSKSYVDEIQGQLDNFQVEKIKLETGEAYNEKDEEIVRLQTEVGNLKFNLKTLEDELKKSKETISHQGSKMRSAANDRFNMQLQFKEELAMISQNMKRELGMFKDMLNKQRNEMTMLRKQNEGLSNDIKDVKDLLVAELCLDNRRSGTTPHRYNDKNKPFQSNRK